MFCNSSESGEAIWQKWETFSDNLEFLEKLTEFCRHGEDDVLPVSPFLTNDDIANDDATLDEAGKPLENEGNEMFSN